MFKQVTRFCLTIAALCLSTQTYAGDKPLKVFILSGQSNMQGKARVSTIDRLKLPGGDKEMYEAMMGEDGKLAAPKGVYGVTYVNGDMKKGEARPLEIYNGPMLPGYAEDPGDKLRYGPEYTFGIYMQRHLNEPILIIKSAWGGRDLLQQFRSPSAGPYEEAKDGHGNETGAYYKLLIQNVEKTLNNLEQYHPEYDPAQGYEIAGFVWFQGFNDMIKDSYDQEYSEYSRVLSEFIRDVRKDLNVPKLPFVIGVMGIGGPIENESDKQARFRKAQALPASLPEFEGNVAAVHTAQYWDMEYERLMAKVKKEAEKRILAMPPEERHRNFPRQTRIMTEKITGEVLSEAELAIVKGGTSNPPFHYLGSALIYGSIGKAFADAMHKLSANN